LNAIASLPSVDAPVLLGVNLDGDAGRAAAVAESLHLPMVVDVVSTASMNRPSRCWSIRDGRVRGAVARQIKELQS